MYKALKSIRRFGPFVVIFILLIIIGIKCSHDSVEEVPPVIKRIEQVIDKKQITIDSITGVVERLVQKRKTDSVASASREMAYKREIRAYKKQVEQLRIVAQPALDTMPEVAALVAAQDTVILNQDKRIDSLSVEKFKMKQDYDLQLKLDESKFKEVVEMNDHLRETANHYKKLNRKLRRQNTWLKVGIVAVSLVAIFKE